MTNNIGMRWWAAVHNTPGAYIRSPSGWMVTVKRPCALLANAIPTDAGAEYPTPAPPEPPKWWWYCSIGHKRLVQPLLAPLTASDQSSFLTAAPTSAASRAVVTGLASHATAAASRAAS